MDVMEKGEAAQRIMTDPIVVAAFEDLEADCFAKFKRSIGDEKALRDAQLMMQGLQMFRTEMVRHISNAEIAAHGSDREQRARDKSNRDQDEVRRRLGIA